MVTISHCKWKCFTWNLEKSSLLHLCPWEVVIQWVSVLLSRGTTCKNQVIFYRFLLAGKRDLVFNPSCIYFFVPITSSEKAICFSLSSHSSVSDHLRVLRLLSLALAGSELKSHLFWMVWCFSEYTSFTGIEGPARSVSEAGEMFSQSFGTGGAWIG